MSNSHKSLFPGFTVVNERLFVFEPRLETGNQNTVQGEAKTHPSTILLCTWGHAHPKHVVKYTDQYRKLYPSARIVIVTSTIIESMFTPAKQHIKTMQPVVDAARLLHNGDEARSLPSRVLVHAMSNSGTVSFITTLLAYKDRCISLGEPLPKPSQHTLLVLDSAPSSVRFWENMFRWSRALAIGTTSKTPIPLWLGQFFWGVFLIAVEVSALIASAWAGGQIGRMMETSVRDPTLATTEATRLYLYSRGDEITSYKQIEENMALARQQGYACLAEDFERSGHVEHARMFPDRYWGAITRAWDEAVEKESRT